MAVKALEGGCAGWEAGRDIELRSGSCLSVGSWAGVESSESSDSGRILDFFGGGTVSWSRFASGLSETSTLEEDFLFLVWVLDEEPERPNEAELDSDREADGFGFVRSSMNEMGTNHGGKRKDLEEKNLYKFSK